MLKRYIIFLVLGLLTFNTIIPVNSFLLGDKYPLSRFSNKEKLTSVAEGDYIFTYTCRSREDSSIETTGDYYHEMVNNTLNVKEIGTNGTYLRYAGFYTNITLPTDSDRKNIAIDFEGRAKSTSDFNYITNLNLALFNEQWTKKIDLRTFVAGNTLDSGWNNYTHTFEDIPTNETYHVYFFLSDGWVANYSQEINVREVNIEIDTYQKELKPINVEYFEFTSRTRGNDSVEASGEYIHYIYNDTLIVIENGTYGTNLLFVGFYTDITFETANTTINFYIEFEGRAKSDYEGDYVTNLRFALYNENWTIIMNTVNFVYGNTLDSGWNTHSHNFSFIPTNEIYHIFFFYNDAWSTNWYQEINVRNVKISASEPVTSEQNTNDSNVNDFLKQLLDDFLNDPYTQLFTIIVLLEIIGLTVLLTFIQYKKKRMK